MAATGKTPIITFHSLTPTVQPTVGTGGNLAVGELAINIPDGKLFFTDGTTLFNFSTGGGGGTTTNSLTVNNSGTGTASPFTFNGSAAQTISYNSIGASPLAGSASLTTLGAVTSGTINNVVIGGTTPAAITGTTITATTGIFGGSF